MPHELSLPVAHPMREVQSVLHHADCFCVSDADEGPRAIESAIQGERHEGGFESRCEDVEG